jgi:acetoacetate decarboxylase
MGRIRYGARSIDELRNREVEATGVDTWATSLTAVYETDPDAIAAVLPPPLVPSGEPLVRIAIATVDIGRGRPPFGAGTFAVEAVHQGLVGNYPLVMPMTTEQAVVGGRETFGEPKKLAEVSLVREGDHIHGSFARMGCTFLEIDGTIVGEADPVPDRRRTDFYFKFLPAPDGQGFDTDPNLVYCHRDEKTRTAQRVEGTITLRDSRFDPVADLPVRNVRWIEVAERSSRQTGELRGTVPADSIRPYVHQRYDDLSPVGAD